MASLYADVEKTSDDLQKEVFPQGKNNFETEFVSKHANGTKVQTIFALQKDGSLFGTLKTTCQCSCIPEVKSEFKAQLATNNQTKIDSTFASDHVPGLKLKLGTTDTNVNGGFDYVHSSIAANFKLDLPFRGSTPGSLEGAAVFVTGSFSIGAKTSYVLSGKDNPEFETKLAKKSDSHSVALTVQRLKNAELLLGLGYFNKLSDSKSVAVKLHVSPNNAGFFLSKSELSVVASNQINVNTLVKARFNTSSATVAFGVSNVINENLKVELGTELPVSGAPGSLYNLKFIYGN